MTREIPWTCKTCGAQTYNDDLMRDHHRETDHTMILGSVEDKQGNSIPAEEIWAGFYGED